MQLWIEYNHLLTAVGKWPIVRLHGKAMESPCMSQGLVPFTLNSAKGLNIYALKHAAGGHNRTSFFQLKELGTGLVGGDARYIITNEPDAFETEWGVQLYPNQWILLDP